MKTSPHVTYKLDPEVDRKIESGHIRLMETARINGRHLAEKNLPDPRGGRVTSYTGEIKAGYERLIAEVLESTQPATHYPESKIDADFYRLKCEGIDTSINELERQNLNDSYHLNGYDPGGIISRLLIVLFLTGLVFLGEAIFNTKAFLITGDNLLFATTLSVCLSAAVFIFSHVSVFLIKKSRSVWKRRLIIASVLLLVTGLFIAMAVFRSRYLEAHGVIVEPYYFVIINIFFFIVSALMSYFFLPSWEELKEANDKRKISRQIKRRNKEIKSLNGQKDLIKVRIKDDSKMRARMIYLTKYVLNKVQKMYREAQATFISTNLNFRRDGQCPSCFNDQFDDISIDIDERGFTQLKLKSE
jgi:hypothetical protein